MHDTLSTLSVTKTLSPTDTGRMRLAARSARRQPLVVRGAALLACLDTLAALVALLAVLINVSLPIGDVDGFLSARITVKNVLLLILVAGLWPIVFNICGLYNAQHVRRFGDEAQRLLLAVTAGSMLALVFPLTSLTGTMTVGDLRYFWVAALTMCLLIRIGRRATDRAQQRQVRRALIVGTGPLANRVYRDLSSGRSHRYEIVGFVDEPSPDGQDIARVPHSPMGTLDQLEQILMRQVIDEVIIALPVKSRYEQIQHVISVCERGGVQAKYGADLFESTVAFQRYHEHGDRAFLAMHVTPDGYRLVVKRAIDILGSIGGLLVFGPLFVLIAIAIKLTSRGPIIYSQERCGLNKRPLRMYKFRSMYANAERQQPSLESLNEATGPVFKIRDDPRITPLGRLLRKSSLDELPQLWNVLRGDMSLVGPRPLPWRDVQRITRPSAMRRVSMRPGLTCLWQVQGRNNIDFDRWVELDLRYIDTWSLPLDIWILVKTIPAVLSGNGAE